MEKTGEKQRPLKHGGLRPERGHGSFFCIVALSLELPDHIEAMDVDCVEVHSAVLGLTKTSAKLREKAS